MSKIQIWKRITTSEWDVPYQIQLYLICQRYKFESESQQLFGEYPDEEAVFNMSKIQIWKRITTAIIYLHQKLLLYLICQRYKFESESQPLIVPCVFQIAVFNMSKIQIWKRITTEIRYEHEAGTLYLICQRYKFESESQHICCLRLQYSRCI